MDPDFYSRVADEFGEYTSGGLRTDVFPDGDPEAAFDELARGLGGPDARLVDIGCADGRSLLRIAPAFGSVLGIDMSASMLESAERKREAVGLDGVSFEQRDASRTGLPDGEADVLTSRRGPLFPEEFRRVLKPGGHLVYMGIGETDARELKEVFGRGQLYGRWDGRPVMDEVVEELTAAGFTVVLEKAFRTEEFYHSPVELDTFLRQVPIFEDYDTEADRPLFERYVASAAGDRGVRLDRHWFVVQARVTA
ncbi:class I SAM-dependent methyltransferase [Streptacidiphilus sp. PB12-B1b]|uniref:class I SAM-dependent methyltransferase n=1 Tax=Streptacidiphilus sp. PB12-B1b TaxID=2705012 RepID=UPI001CDD0FAC|nr:class I SAM-dependent methyltransferase [Streptacidiphilus sp. PB12-B1b]